MTIKVFISYSDGDRRKMRALQKCLRSHSVLQPLIIADDRKPSTLLSDKVKNGINECHYFVPILTSTSIKNQWVNQEIGFATAKEKHIVPIVASHISGRLKGFVHKQTDLSFQYKATRSQPSLEGRRFSSEAKVLVDWLLTQNKITPVDLSPESLFPGVWELEYNYQGSGKIDHDRKVEIRNGNEYHVSGKLQFLLDDFRVDLKKKTLRFTKRRPDPSRPTAFNELRIVPPHRRSGVSRVPHAPRPLAV